MRELLPVMQELVSDANYQRAIEQACDACETELHARPEIGETWRVVIPLLELSGEASALRSLWVFAFAPHGASDTHRHSNSTQYTRAWRGRGVLRIGDPAAPTVVHLPPVAASPETESQWAIIPAGVFHQAVADADGWCVVSFQTVPAAELQDEPVVGEPQPYVTQ